MLAQMVGLMTRQMADVEVGSWLSTVIAIDVFSKNNMNSIERGEITCLVCMHYADLSYSCAIYNR